MPRTIWAASRTLSCWSTSSCRCSFPAEKKLQLDQLIEDLHNPASPNYHKWLTADEFRRDFSPAPEDVETVTAWLASQGFSINVTYPGSIDFSGTAAQILPPSGPRFITSM